MNATTTKRTGYPTALAGGLLLILVLSTTSTTGLNTPPLDGDVTPELTIVSCLVDLSSVEALQGFLASTSDACDPDGGILVEYLQSLMQPFAKKIACWDQGGCTIVVDGEIACPEADYAAIATYSGEAPIGIIQCIADSNPPGGTPSAVPNALACSAAGRYFQLEADDGSSCMDPLEDPYAGSTALFDGLGGHICTGTNREAVSGTASATYGINYVLEAKVTYSATVSVLTSWNFACDFNQIGSGFGGGGLFRECRLETRGSETPWVPKSDPKPYDGVARIGCNVGETIVAQETFHGHGYADGFDVLLPMETNVKPGADSEFKTVRLVNAPLLPGTSAVSDVSGWNEQGFAIHYQ